MVSPGGLCPAAAVEELVCIPSVQADKSAGTTPPPVSARPGSGVTLELRSFFLPFSLLYSRTYQNMSRRLEAVPLSYPQCTAAGSPACY